MNEVFVEFIKMKFIIDGVAGKTVATGCATAAARAGQLEVRSTLPVLDTPAPLIRCRGGAIPHLTHETLQYLDTANKTLLIPYQAGHHCSIHTFRS